MMGNKTPPGPVEAWERPGAAPGAAALQQGAAELHGGRRCTGTAPRWDGGGFAPRPPRMRAPRGRAGGRVGAGTRALERRG